MVCPPQCVMELLSSIMYCDIEANWEMQTDGKQ